MANSILCITTKDNPYDPVNDFINWYQYDCQKGYNTCSILARISKTTDSLSESENEEEIERAIDCIIENDPFNIYKKVKIEEQ